MIVCVCIADVLTSIVFTSGALPFSWVAGGLPCSIRLRMPTNHKVEALEFVQCALSGCQASVRGQNRSTRQMALLRTLKFGEGGSGFSHAYSRTLRLFQLLNSIALLSEERHAISWVDRHGVTLPVEHLVGSVWPVLLVLRRHDESTRQLCDVLVGR